MDYEIIKKPTFRVVGMQVQTTMKDGKHAKDCPMIWTKFMPRVKEIKNLQPRVCYGLCIMTSELDFNYIAGVESNDQIPDEMIETKIPESEYIKTTHKGQVSTIGKTWELLMSKMLPESGRKGDMMGVSFEYYGEKYKDDETNETDIYFPLIKV